MKHYLLYFLSFLSFQVSANDFNCYTLVAGNKTTVDGSVMMAHNEDDSGEQMLNWYRVPAIKHKQGENLQFRHGAQEPLPAGTFGYLWLELPKMDVSDGFLNDRGVAIVSDGCPSKEDRMDVTDGGMVYELRQIVAMQATSARHAVDIIGYLVEKFGYASSGRTYCVADAKEAWVVAVVQGRHWVAQRVPDNHVMALANTYNIDRVNLADRENFAGSADLIPYAIERGWYKPKQDGEFSFRKAYAAPGSYRHPNNIARAWFAICLLSGKEYPKNSELPFSFEPSQNITLSDMMEVLSSHYHDTPWKERRTDVPHNTENSICQGSTQYGVVFQLRSNMPVEIGAVAWIAPYHPCIHTFTPWYTGINNVPAEYARYNSYTEAMANHFTDTENFRTKFPDKIYWKLVDETEQIKKDYARNMATIKPQNDKIQKELFQRQSAFEDDMLRLYQQDKDQCRSALTGYTFNHRIKKVHLVFKTHLDIGYTDLSSLVERKYIEEFIPKTLDIIDQLKAEGAPERYVWTTGSWLVSEYLKQATPEAVKRLEDALLRGDIVWNGVPYTVESEIMSKEHFAACLKLSQQLDRRFGKTTLAAKMTDVPGHTRSIVTQLSDAGISLLHIGVNGASAVPEVPPISRWKNTDGKEIVLIYQGVYGEDMILPDGETVVSINFTNDNVGPHSLEHIKQIYARAKSRYPNATIAATSLNEVARDIQTMMDKIPVLTSEIGDTWIYGFGSSPLRIARFKALSRLFTQWVHSGKLDMNSPATIDFAVRLGMIAEHTWGFDIKTHLKNWDKYDVDAFNAARHTQPFKLTEQSWAEVDANIDKAVALLPAALQKEARKELEIIGKPAKLNINSQDRHPQLNENGVYRLSVGGLEAMIGELTYKTFSTDDFHAFHNMYLRSKPAWALSDFGKPGLENSKAKSATAVATVKNCKITDSKNQKNIQCKLQFAGNQDIDSRVFPESALIEYTVPTKGNRVEMKVTLVNKPAVRLPEAYFLSFVPSGIQRILAEKMGFMVDVTDVVAGGNRQMHAIDNCIDLITDKGTVRITSLDAPFAVIGERNMLNYSKHLPELNKGVHFCLFNNLWGTNFTMWWEGNITYRFIIEVI